MVIAMSTDGPGGNPPEGLMLEKSTQQPLTMDRSEPAVAEPNVDAGLQAIETSLEKSHLPQMAQHAQIEAVAEDSSSDSDSELEDSSTLEKPTLSDRRRIQNLKFNSLLVSWD